MTSTRRECLPGTVKPSHYDIFIHNIKYVDEWSFSGTVVIDASVQSPTTEVVLNVRDLAIDSAQIQIKNGATISATSITYDLKLQRASLVFPSELPLGSSIQLMISFHGGITDVMAGFYHSKYIPAATPDAAVPRENDYCYMLSTQFEPCDARRAFPCFDEPSLKATFDLRVEIPETLTAISNMPVKNTKIIDNGLKIVSFDRTPVMSTYLLCWGIGDFEYIEGFARSLGSDRKLPVRVYATRGLKERCRFGLQETINYLEYFNQIFQIEFPLPKMDCLAVHEVCNVAMENWGLMTFSTTTILYEHVTSDVRYQNRVAYIIAHELAHQWFGDLVTMEWWNDVWLNEGFATWAGWLAVDHFHPDWQVWEQFSITGLQRAFELDSLEASHPIVVEVTDSLDAGQVFDDISYLKGASILRMLSTYLGVETFLSGVSAYLKAHSYSNATTQDLWSALSNASGIDVAKFMDAWTRKMGYPVIHVTEAEKGLHIHQSRFLLNRPANTSSPVHTWPIPLNLKPLNDLIMIDTEYATVKEATIVWSLSNVEQNGFYRIRYPLEKLDGNLAKNFSQSELTGIVGDVASFAMAGQCSSSIFLRLLSKIEFGDNIWLWSQVLQNLSNIRSIFSDSSMISDGLARYILDLISTSVEAIGWTDTDNEGILRKQLRGVLFTTAGSVGHQGVITEAMRRFDLYTSGTDKSAIDPSLRVAVFSTVIHNGGMAEYEAVMDEYLNNTSVDGKDVGLTALGSVQQPEIILKYLDFVFAGNVTLQDVRVCATALAANPQARRQLWKYVQDNWEYLQKRMGKNFSVLERFVKLCLVRFSDRAVLNEIEDFFGKKDTGGFNRSLSAVIETIRVNVNYRERDEEDIIGWLTLNGYI
ncbi:putative aminopeptidase [Xylogone sp. PMI_703]|nr:putative aminopeptidase [Xylogone sp. PMI_703]